MDYVPLPDNAARQFIDSTTVFEEYTRVQALAAGYIGGMYWKRQGEHVYLTKTLPGRVQQRLGPRSAETEAIYDAFNERKKALEQRLRTLRHQLESSERLNKALRVGRVPATVVSLLQALEIAGLRDHFVVVGTHALYAYEAAAGVRVMQAAIATEDVDLLWDARKRIQFAHTMERQNVSMIEILRRVDPTFERLDDDLATAINAMGFKVEFLRRSAEADDEHPLRLSAKKNDLYAVQANRANVLTNAPAFEHTVVSSTGRMATMRTIDPQVFVEFKQWMGTEAQDRPPSKRRRDLLQAALVQSLISDGLLLTSSQRMTAADADEEDELPDARPSI